MADAREAALGLIDSLAELICENARVLEAAPEASICEALKGAYPLAWAFVADLGDALGEIGLEMPEAVARCDPLGGRGAELPTCRDMLSAGPAIGELRARVAAAGGGGNT